MRRRLPPPPAAPFRRFRGHWIAAFFLLGILCLGAVLVWFTEGTQVLREIRELRMGPVLLALLAVGAAYGSTALSFSGLFALTRFTVPFGPLFSVTLISSTFNYVVSSGGLSSLAVRAYLFKAHRVPYSVTVPVSAAQSMVTNIVLALLCAGGLAHLVALRGPVPGVGVGLLVVLVGTLLALVGIWALGFFHAGFRAAVLAAVERLGTLLGRIPPFRFLTAARLAGFRSNVERSVRLLHRGWLQLLVTFFWVLMDWFFTILALNFCFQAVGERLSWGLLLLGFALALLTSTLNLVPAGLGVTEGVVVGVFVHLGLDAEKVMVSTLLFRLLYYILPLAVSAALYLETLGKLVRQPPFRAIDK